MIMLMTWEDEDGRTNETEQHREDGSENLMNSRVMMTLMRIRGTSGDIQQHENVYNYYEDEGVMTIKTSAEGKVCAE